MKANPLIRVLPLAAALALAGCMNLAPVHQRPDAPVPATLGAADATGPALQASEVARGQAQALGWVRSAPLQQVIALALSNNRDLQVALLNIERARALYGVQQADLLPTVAVSSQGTRARTAADLTTAGRSQLSSQYNVQLGFTSFELDLWGRVRNLNEAALQQFLSTEETRRNVQLGLVADVANAWLTLAADQARLQLAQDTQRGRERSLALTQRIFELGGTSGLVLAQAQSALETARVDVAAFTSQVARDRNALQLLVGGPLPADLWPAALQPGVHEAAALLPVPAPLPSSVLLERPDIRVAERTLQAASANIGAARAALFPTISLTASAGTASNELSGLFGAGNGTWSFAPGIRLPIFDGGRGQANVRVAELNQQVAVAQYEKAVQVAFREVSDALADRATWADRLGAQHALVTASQKALDLSQARFTAGTDNYLTVLDAQRSLYAAQQTLIGLQLAEQLNRITFYKVLGGLQTLPQ